MTHKHHPNPDLFYVAQNSFVICHEMLHGRFRVWNAVPVEYKTRLELEETLK